MKTLLILTVLMMGLILACCEKTEPLVTVDPPKKVCDPAPAAVLSLHDIMILWDNGYYNGVMNYQVNGKLDFNQHKLDSLKFVELAKPLIH